MRRIRLAPLVLLGSLALAAGVHARQNPQTPVDFGSPAFESYLEVLRQQAGIPGLSGALVEDGDVAWEAGLGFADQETRVRATPNTPYLIGDVTSSLSAVLLLQCVEQRRFGLDAPIRSYLPTFPEAGATLRQLLSHTLPAGSGGTFRYDAGRYAELTAVMEYCAPQPFRKSVAHRLLERLGMTDSVPGRVFADDDALPEGLFEPEALARYARVLRNLAVPYRVDRRGRATRTDVPVEGINAASGVVSTARDLVRFDRALDSRVLLLDETLDAAWSPAPMPNGGSAPAGLGWFVQAYRGTTVVWQYGLLPNAYSALIVKVPSRRTTLILLANSDGLVVPFQLDAGDVTRSPFASLFLRMLL
jgi:CubicO group peptidase (beta-lactamase class C family)